MSDNTYTHGLFVLDVLHMPFGCGVWPAYWLVGPDWPSHGEIDIIEGVNLQEQNSISLHTDEGCTIAGSGQTGDFQTSDCNSAVNGNSGCGTKLNEASTPNNYGAALNANGGGYYVTEWTSNYVKHWFFDRTTVPDSITNGSPDPATFGVPAANQQGSCDIDSHFGNMTIVINTDFCGAWAGWVYSMAESCPQAPGLNSIDSCVEFVGNNPTSFTEAYWEINSIEVYQIPSNVETVSAYSTSLSSVMPEATANTIEQGMGAPTTALSSSAYTGPLSEVTTMTPSSDVMTSAAVDDDQNPTPATTPSPPTYSMEPMPFSFAKCPDNDRAIVVDDMGIVYELGCSSDTSTGAIDGASAPNGFHDCFALCHNATEAYGQFCASFVYTGGSNGVGGGNCYFKSYADQGTIFVPSDDTKVAAIRLSASEGGTSMEMPPPSEPTGMGGGDVPSPAEAPPPPPGFPGMMTGVDQPPAATVITSSVMSTPTPPTCGSPYVDPSSGAAYSVHCGMDNSGADLIALPVSEGGFAACFPACAGYVGCVGFTFLGEDSGTCYLKTSEGAYSPARDTVVSCFQIPTPVDYSSTEKPVTITVTGYYTATGEGPFTGTGYYPEGGPRTEVADGTYVTSQYFSGGVPQTGVDYSTPPAYSSQNGYTTIIEVISVSTIHGDMTTVVAVTSYSMTVSYTGDGATSSTGGPSSGAGFPSTMMAGGTTSMMASSMMSSRASNTSPAAGVQSSAAASVSRTGAPPAPPCPTEDSSFCGGEQQSTSCSSSAGNTYDIKCGVYYEGTIIDTSEIDETGGSDIARRGPHDLEPAAELNARNVDTSDEAFNVFGKRAIEPSLAACQALCDRTAGCVALNYLNRNCELLSSVSGTSLVPGTVGASVSATGTGPPPYSSGSSAPLPTGVPPPTCPGSAGSSYTDAAQVVYGIGCYTTFPGNDIGTPVSASSFVACLPYCDALSGCSGVLYNVASGLCYLKSSFNSVSGSDPNIIYGIRNRAAPGGYGTQTATPTITSTLRKFIFGKREYEATKLT